jgi:peptidyl-prolyl cis-trans isomerase SurA
MKTQVLLGVLVLAALDPMWAQLVSSHPSTQPVNQTTTIAQPAGKPVARVNGTALTDRDLAREMYTIFPYAKQHNGAVPKEMEDGIRNGAMQMIIFEELVYQQALRRKLTIPPARLQSAEKDFRGQFSSPQEYQQVLQSDFQGSEKVLREKVLRSLLIDALLKIEVDNKAIVSLVEERGYYDKNPARFHVPEAFAIQTISFIAPEKATPQQLVEARKKAENALPQAKAAKSYEEFGLLAEKVSEDDYRVMMGDHKAIPRTQVAPQVLQALLAMKPGDVSGVLQVAQVYTIIRLNKHIPASKVKFEDVKAQLKTELTKQKTNQVRAALDKKLRQNAKIEVL